MIGWEEGGVVWLSGVRVCDTRIYVPYASSVLSHQHVLVLAIAILSEFVELLLVLRLQLR